MTLMAYQKPLKIIESHNKIAKPTSREFIFTIMEPRK